MFYVSLQAVATADYKLTLTSITGTLIWQEEFSGITGHHLKQIDLSGIESGVYIIKLSSIHTSICRKILVE
jgi:hypothetical protein